jgi:hypothetical protein
MKPAPFKCGKCGSPAELTVEDETTGSLLCPLGHRQYFYKNERGRWESGEERMERMKVTQTCTQCGQPFAHFMDRGEAKRDKCNACLKDTAYDMRVKLRAVKTPEEKRNNMNSPWRMNTKAVTGGTTR